jgi:energy-coupling factor transporter ATP-binding protein EcfA2
MQLFEQLNRQGITVVLVTHEPDIAAHAARVLTVHDGLLDSDVHNQHDRPGDNIWQRPPSLGTATNGRHPVAKPRLSITRRPAFMAKRRHP